MTSSSKDAPNHPNDGITLGSSTSRSNPNRSPVHRESTDLSGPITAGVVERMNAKERDLITSKMMARNYPIPALWPKVTFARVYMKHGNNAEIREYAQLQLDAAKVEQAFAAIKAPKEGDISSGSECGEVKNSLRSYITSQRKGPGVWNRVESGMQQETCYTGTRYLCNVP